MFLRASIPAVIVALLTGCNPKSSGDTASSTGDGGSAEDTGMTGTDFCAVRDMFSRSCTSCHGAISPSGGLDLATDPYGSLVGVTSSLSSDWQLVVPGNPEASLLYLKLADTQPEGLGTMMPPTTPMSASTVSAVDTWIADGASDQCDEPPDTGGTVYYHPEGWVAADVHGLAAKLQSGELPAEACVTCHGEDLNGGSVGVGCDGCHLPDEDADAWRTDCTFCHGGTEDETGAPPRDIDGTTDTAALSFSAHGAHVNDGENHDAFDCTACHEQPTDVLSDGHLFLGDATPGAAELDFSGGLSHAGRYSGGGSCSNLYCHGYKGLDNGSWSVSKGTPDCADCHPDATSGGDAWETRMSSSHKDHLEKRVKCGQCHAATVNTSDVVTDPSKHVDGTVEVMLTDAGITWSGGRCTGSCHAGGESEYHENERWE